MDKILTLREALEQNEAPGRGQKLSMLYTMDNGTIEIHSYMCWNILQPSSTGSEEQQGIPGHAHPSDWGQPGTRPLPHGFQKYLDDQLEQQATGPGKDAGKTYIRKTNWRAPGRRKNGAKRLEGTRDELKKELQQLQGLGRTRTCTGSWYTRQKPGRGRTAVDTAIIRGLHMCRKCFNSCLLKADILANVAWGTGQTPGTGGRTEHLKRQVAATARLEETLGRDTWAEWVQWLCKDRPEHIREKARNEDPWKIGWDWEGNLRVSVRTNTKNEWGYIASLGHHLYKNGVLYALIPEQLGQKLNELHDQETRELRRGIVRKTPSAWPRTNRSNTSRDTYVGPSEANNTTTQEAFAIFVNLHETVTGRNSLDRKTLDRLWETSVLCLETPVTAGEAGLAGL